ncbi:MAG TPA: phosphomannose isomerase type II C-terminal cupin domain [Acetobacteraceae bacterium]|jgi:mannose-6-phosphate isomerase-like protein (cupin superfamily)
MSIGYVLGQRDERPWGAWEIVAVGPGYAVKRIVVRPGQRLSLQRHAFRAEHWVVVSGLARVARGTEMFALSPGGHAAIGRGDAHRIENPGTEDLVFIEVQHGERLDENDIERLLDDYGRSVST